MITAQEAFNKVVNHLLSMKQRSVTSNKLGESCKYRGHNGSMCAIGCLINDEFYNEYFDIRGFGADNIEIRDALIASGNGIRDKNIDQDLFYKQLQCIHDRNNSWYFHKNLGLNERGLRKLINFANTYNLKIPNELTQRLENL